MDDVRGLAEMWANRRGAEDGVRWDTYAFYPVNADQVNIDITAVTRKPWTPGRRGVFAARIVLPGFFMATVKTPEDLADFLWRKMDEARVRIIEEMDSVD